MSVEKLRSAAHRRRAGRGVERHSFSPFRYLSARQQLKLSLSVNAGKAQTGLAKGTEAALDAYIQEPGLEAWTFLVTWALNFVYCNRHGERAERPETLSAAQAEALAQLRKYIRGFLSGPRCLFWIGQASWRQRGLTATERR